MAHRHLRIVFITLIAVVTAGCGAGATGTVPSLTPSAVTGEVPSLTPSATSTIAPSPTPSAPTPGGQANATLTLGAFGNADGPGLSVTDAIAKSGVEPLLVNGILLKTADGSIWLCTVLASTSPPRCAEPRLLVESWSPDDQTFVSGEGLHEAAGVRWVDRVQLFGVVRPKGPASPSQAAGWRVVATQPDLAPAHLRDLTTFRGSLVAVGATDAALGAIWSSADGEVWTSIAGTTPLDGMLLHAVAVGDPGIVVVGWTETDAVALFSPDGVSWSRRPLPGSHPGSSIESVAWRQGRFVAVGGGGEPGAVVAWISDDGRTWSPVSIYEEGNQASLNSVAAGPGGFVADGMYRLHPVVWTSSDGKTWRRSDLQGSIAADPGRLRFAGGHFFIAGTNGELWSSGDGQHWSRTTVPGFGVGVFDVAAIPGGFVAVGRSSEGSQPGVVATADRDLTRWTLQPTDATMSGALASSVLVSPDGAYLVGVGMSLSEDSVFLLADPSSLMRP